MYQFRAYIFFNFLIVQFFSYACCSVRLKKKSSMDLFPFFYFRSVSKNSRCDAEFLKGVGNFCKCLNFFLLNEIMCAQNVKVAHNVKLSSFGNKLQE